MTDTPTYSKRKYLSVSTLMDFVRCPRRYFYKKSGLIVAGEEPSAPLYGQAMHKALPIGMTQGLTPALAAFSEIWNEELADDKRNFKRATQQISHFLHTHKDSRALYRLQPPPSGSIQLDEATSDFEVPFAVDVGLPVPITGRIDALVQHRDTGEYWGWEFKTVSGYQWSRIFDGLEMHPQVLTYTMVLRTVSGLPVRGVMAEAMLIDKTKIDNQLAPIIVQDQLVQGIHEWLRYYGELLLACEAAAERLVATGEYDQDLRWLISSRPFPRNFAGCTPYPLFYMTSSWGCEYQNLCRVEDPRNLLSLYNIKPEHDMFANLTVEGQ